MIILINQQLNRLTMYRLALYYLIGLEIVAVILSTFGLLPFHPFSLIISAGILVIASQLANSAMAKVFGATTNKESYAITALILSLILQPATDFNGLITLMIVGILAMASKYLLAINKKHIFNPAAIAVVLSGLFLNQYASWWVGTTLMVPFVVIGGLLLVHKINRFKEVGIFVLATFTLLVITYILRGATTSSIVNIMQLALIKSSFFFFAFVMFTEPLTSPNTRNLQTGFAIVASLLYTTPQIHPFGIVLTPEMALCFANIFSLISSPNQKLFLKLKEVKQIAQSSYELVFDKPKNFNYHAGQFMEWTLPHPNPDSRGNRRYFTLASAPEEDNLAIAIKYNTPPSSFKKNLIEMKPGQTIIAAELAGHFTLPKNKEEKLVFIAGGIGIVPFRSMIAHITKTKEKRDIVLFYSNKNFEDICFTADFILAKGMFNLRTVYALDSAPANWPGYVGFIDQKLIEQNVPDYKDRTFYISGPPKMVDNFKIVLNQMGVHKNKIKSDYFPGY